MTEGKPGFSQKKRRFRSSKVTGMEKPEALRVKRRLDAAAFVYNLNAGVLVEEPGVEIPEEDREVLNSYVDPMMFVDVSIAAEDIVGAVNQRASARGRSTSGLGANGGLELIAAIGMWMVENGIDRLPDRVLSKE